MYLLHTGKCSSLQEIHTICIGSKRTRPRSCQQHNRRIKAGLGRGKGGRWCRCGSGGSNHTWWNYGMRLRNMDWARLMGVGRCRMRRKRNMSLACVSDWGNCSNGVYDLGEMLPTANVPSGYVGNGMQTYMCNGVHGFTYRGKIGIGQPRNKNLRVKRQEAELCLALRYHRGCELQRRGAPGVGKALHQCLEHNTIYVKGYRYWEAARGRGGGGGGGGERSFVFQRPVNNTLTAPCVCSLGSFNWVNEVDGRRQTQIDDASIARVYRSEERMNEYTLPFLHAKMHPHIQA